MPTEKAFGILGLPIDARAEAVKAAFRRLAKRYHPDINPEENKEGFILIEQAYRRALAVLGTAM